MTAPTSGGQPRELATITLVDDRPVTPPGIHYVAATFSPDGAMLAVAAAGHEAIDLVDPDGEGVSTTRLVAGERSGYRFVWAPDGGSVVYRTAGGGLGQVWVDGRSATLVESGESAGFPTYTSAGTLLYSRRGVVRALEGAPTPVVAHRGLVTVTAAAAPRLAGWDGEHIFSADLITGEQRVLFSGAGFFDVQLSADGELAVVRESRGAEAPYLGRCQRWLFSS